MVAEIDDQVAEGGGADLPGGAGAIPLAIDAGHQGDEAVFIGALGTGRRSGAMAPAQEISTCLLHLAQRVIGQPVRQCRAESRPFLGGFLAPAVELERMAVDPEAGGGIETEVADAERGFGHVTGDAVGNDGRADLVDVGISGLPEMRIFNL